MGQDGELHIYVGYVTFQLKKLLVSRTFLLSFSIKCGMVCLKLLIPVYIDITFWILV